MPSIKSNLKKLTAQCFSVVSTNLLEMMLDLSVKELSRKSAFYFTYHKRPKFSHDVNVISNFDVSTSEKFAILIQGPVIANDKFTIETIRLYKNIFPSAHILVSTWDDTPSDQLQLLENEKIQVLLNVKPATPGRLNFNYQIKSTYSGLKELKEQQFKFVLKTRTDQRCYSANLYPFLRRLLEQYSLPNNVKLSKQRIVIGSLNTFKYRLFNISDMFMFGNIDDLLMSWDIPFDNETLRPSDYNFPELTIGKLLEIGFPERELLYHIALQNGETIDVSLKKYWDILSRYFIICDNELLDLYWHKYDSEKEYRCKVYKETPMSGLSFKDWLILQSDDGMIDEAFACEGILDMKLDSQIYNERKI